jgi:phosphosulfolactate synthase (CoM biosynthesis protein A)
MNIAELKAKIKNANALGIANLTEKGVEVSESATTHEIMQSIIEIISGGAELEVIETAIDNSGVLEENEYTLTQKVQKLIDLIKEYQNENPETTVPENVLKSLEGYLLKDKDGLYLTLKESE